jgi:hypothetical protein
MKKWTTEFIANGELQIEKDLTDKQIQFITHKIQFIDSPKHSFDELQFWSTSELIELIMKLEGSI